MVITVDTTTMTLTLSLYRCFLWIPTWHTPEGYIWRHQWQPYRNLEVMNKVDHGNCPLRTAYQWRKRVMNNVHFQRVGWIVRWWRAAERQAGPRVIQSVSMSPTQRHRWPTWSMAGTAFYCASCGVIMVALVVWSAPAPVPRGPFFVWCTLLIYI